MHFKDLTIFAAAILMLAFPSPAQAVLMPEDSTAATIYTYFGISPDKEDDEAGGVPSQSTLSFEKFNDQITELTSGAYTIMPLPELIKAQQAGRSLPRKTVALTFDHLDSAFLKTVAPLLLDKKIPFTLFISASQLDQAQGDVTWAALRTLLAKPGVSLGMTAYNYSHLATWPKEKLTADINQARSRIREELKTEPAFFAYPYGEYSPLYREIVEQQGFSAAFGQNSGVVSKDSDPLTLPRFTITEEFSDLERLRMTSDALPFPVTDIEPASLVLTDKLPFPGFTVPAAIPASELKSLTCFASGAGQMTITLLGKNRVELRFPETLTDGFDTWRGRINCTLPVKTGDDGTEPRWRWLGFLYAVPE